MNAVVPSSFHLHRHMDEAKTAANIALAAQHEVGRKVGRREALAYMGAFGMCCFVGGAAFAAGIAALVSAVLP